MYVSTFRKFQTVESLIPKKAWAVRSARNLPAKVVPQKGDIS